MSITVERARYGELRSFKVLRDGELVTSFTHRDVQALAAARHGHVRLVLRRTYAPWFHDARLDPECDVYGIGYATLVNLQGSLTDDRWQPRLLARADEPGPLGLTALGDQILDAILALPGVHIPIQAAA